MHEPVECFDTLSAKVGDKRVFAYIVSDNDGNYDDLIGEGIGRFIDFRDSRSKEAGEGLAALGLDSCGEKDLDTVYEKNTAEFHSRYLSALKAQNTYEELTDEFDCSADDLHEEIENRVYNLQYIDLPFQNIVEKVLTEMWEDPKYFPGEPYAQLLDCYSHGNDWWSMAGRGMQCRWDTSRGAGVWIPDKYCLEEIHTAGDLDAVAFIEENRLRGKKWALYRVEWVEPEKHVLHEVKTSDSYSELIEERVALHKNRSCNTEWQREWGRQHRAESCCNDFLETHNAVINGDVWGCVCEVFDSDGTQIEEESCWGFIGGDNAEESLEAEFFNPTVKQLKRGLFESLGGEIHPSWYTAPYWPDSQTCSPKKFDNLDDALKFLEEQRDTTTTD